MGRRGILSGSCLHRCCIEVMFHDVLALNVREAFTVVVWTLHSCFCVLRISRCLLTMASDDAGSKLPVVRRPPVDGGRLPIPPALSPPLNLAWRSRSLPALGALDLPSTPASSEVCVDPAKGLKCDSAFVVLLRIQPGQLVGLDLLPMPRGLLVTGIREFEDSKSTAIGHWNCNCRLTYSANVVQVFDVVSIPGVGTFQDEISRLRCQGDVRILVRRGSFQHQPVFRV